MIKPARQGARILAACSGGPDSLALLAGLDEAFELRGEHRLGEHRVVEVVQRLGKHLHLELVRFWIHGGYFTTFNWASPAGGAPFIIGVSMKPGWMALHRTPRGATSIATVVGWVGNLIISFTFLSLLDLIGEAATFFSYAVVAVLGFVFVWFLVPETKGRTLEEIQEGFIERAKRKA